VKVTDEGVPVGTLVRVVKDSLKRAGVSRTSDAKDLRVGSVRLTLEVVASKTAGGGLEFFVPFIGMKLKMGARVTKEETHTIDITLVPPQEPKVREVRGGDVETALVESITTIREAMVSAAGGDDPWVLSEGTVDIKFAVTKTGSISIGADGELVGALTNTLRLVLLPWQP
jgi:hypothetical protein